MDPGAPTGAEGTGGGWYDPTVGATITTNVPADPDPHWQATTTIPITAGTNRTVDFTFTGEGGVATVDTPGVREEGNIVVAQGVTSGTGITGGNPRQERFAIVQDDFVDDMGYVSSWGTSSSGTYRLNFELPEVTSDITTIESATITWYTNVGLISQRASGSSLSSTDFATANLSTSFNRIGDDSMLPGDFATPFFTNLDAFQDLNPWPNAGGTSTSTLTVFGGLTSTSSPNGWVQPDANSRVIQIDIPINTDVIILGADLSFITRDGGMSCLLYTSPSPRDS